MQKFDIGKRMLQIRAKKNIHQDELRKMLGITSKSYLSCIEKNETSPNWKNLERIIHALGVTITEFFSEPSCYITNTSLRKEKELC